MATASKAEAFYLSAPAIKFILVQICGPSASADLWNFYECRFVASTRADLKLYEGGECDTLFENTGFRNSEPLLREQIWGSTRGDECDTLFE